MSDIGTRAGKWLEGAALDVALLAVDAALRIAPEPAGYRMEHGLGWVFRSCLVREQIVRHMKAVLGNPDWPEAKWGALLADHRRWIGHLVIEALYWLRLPANEIRARVSMQGEEHVDEALRSGRGAFIFASHTGNVLCPLARVGELAPDVCVLGNSMPGRGTESRMALYHEKFGIRRWLINRSGSPPFEETKRVNGIIAAFVDMTMVAKHNVWVRFGRAEMLVNLGPAFLALRHDVPVLCATCAFLGEGRHRVDFHPLPPLPRTGNLVRDAHELTRQAMDIVAQEALRDPARWFYWDWASIRPGGSGE